jgi:hypothetical protein
MGVKWVEVVEGGRGYQVGVLGSKGLIGVGVELVVIGRAKSCPAFFKKSDE